VLLFGNCNEVHIAKNAHTCSVKSYIVALAFVATLIVLAVAPAFAQDDLPREETLVLSIGNPVEDPTNLNIYAPGVSRSGTGLHRNDLRIFLLREPFHHEIHPWLATDFSYNDDAKATM
jgi:hypothetical protein